MCQKYGLQDRIRPSCSVSRPEGRLSLVSQKLPARTRSWQCSQVQSCSTGPPYCCSSVKSYWQSYVVIGRYSPLSSPAAMVMGLKAEPRG